MPEKSNQTFITQDGSSSLISSKFGEAYHSRYGALEESRHVFIDAGLDHLLSTGSQTLNVLEIGFGTGLNAVLTLIATRTSSAQLNYSCIEAYPISIEEAALLNYPKLLNIKDDEFLQLHDDNWEKEIQISKNFSFTKHHCKFEDFETKDSFDLIYFDAFAPSIQAHLWESPFLERIYKMCSDNAILVTYCAKGSFKRALKQVGFTLESLPGPAKKREMTRAIKNVE